MEWKSRAGVEVMTDKLRIDADTLAMLLITQTRSELAHDPQGFIDTYDEGFDRDAEHFAEILIVDEFDCPDELYDLFDIAEDETERIDALFALKSNERVYHLVIAALRNFRQLAPHLLPKGES